MVISAHPDVPAEAAGSPPREGPPELLMAVGTTLSRLTGLVRVFALLYALGVTTLSDAYNLANTTPNIIYDLVAGGVLSATLIPVFVEHLDTRREDDAWEGVSAVLTLATVLLVVASVVLVLIAPAVVRGYTVTAAHRYAAAQRTVATTLLRMFAPQVFFYGVITMLTAVLNTRRRFGAPMFVPIVNNLVVTAVLLVAGTLIRHASVGSVRSDHTVLELLGLGTTAGVAAQAVALMPALRGARVRLHWRWNPGHPAVAAVLRLSAWTLGIVIGNQLALYVVLLLANHQLGGPSAYTYAYTFFQMPYAVVAVSIMTARQPRWAAAWALGEVGRLRRDVTAALRSLFALIVPIAVTLAVVADPLIRLFGRHGATTQHGAAVTGQVLAILALGLPGFCAYLTYIRVFQAMQNTRTAFWLYVLENGVNVALAAVLYRPFGVQGVAASVSIAYAVGAVAAGMRLRPRLGETGRVVGRTPASVARRVFMLSVPAGALAWVAEHFVGSATAIGSLEKLLVAGAVAVVTFLIASGIGATGRGDPRRLRR
jgi:putative peptidoglycan lipid II flippase